MPFDQQCARPYANVSDTWRAISNGGYGPGGKIMADRGPNGFPLMGCGSRYKATGVGGGSWYRFTGVGGDALPLTSPGENHCGTGYTGWLSGWNGSEAPPDSYRTAGHYPVAADGVVEMVACFDMGSSRSCGVHFAVGVVQCDGFTLWRLPYASGGCGRAFCTAPSGLQRHKSSARGMSMWKDSP